MNLLFKTVISIFVDLNHNSFRVLFDKIASVYYIWKKCTYILALEMASPRNQHCASCIGTLSFPICCWAPPPSAPSHLLVDILCPRLRALANWPAAVAAVDRRDRQTDARPLYRPCRAYCAVVISNSVNFVSKQKVSFQLLITTSVHGSVVKLPGFPQNQYQQHGRSAPLE